MKVWCWIKSTAPILTLLFMFGFIAYYVMVTRHQTSPQLSVTRELLTPVIKVGDSIRIRVTVTRTRPCPTSVHTWFVNDIGDVVASRITNSPFSSVVGTISAVIDTPSENLPPGRYRIMADGILTCGADVFVSPNPVLEIQIVAR